MIKIKSLSKDLKNRIEVYAKNDSITEFGEKTFSYTLLKKVWGSISPVTSYAKKEEKLKGETTRTNTTHKITIRMKAIKEPMNDMYFMFKGQKYEVQYYNPNYKYNDVIEFYCKLIIETEEDYGYARY